MSFIFSNNLWSLSFEFLRKFLIQIWNYLIENLLPITLGLNLLLPLVGIILVSFIAGLKKKIYKIFNYNIK